MSMCTVPPKFEAPKVYWDKNADLGNIPPCDITLPNGIAVTVESDMIVEVVPDALAEQIAKDRAKLAEDLAEQAEEFPK